MPLESLHKKEGDVAATDEDLIKRLSNALIHHSSKDLNPEEAGVSGLQANKIVIQSP